MKKRYSLSLSLLLVGAFLAGQIGLPVAAAHRPVPETLDVPTFSDVPADYWAYAWIEALSASRITTGCSPGQYCPEDSVTRAQMAVFIERGLHGPEYVPPAADGTAFEDVAPSYWAAAWIEKLFADGITTGCGSRAYCPDSPVTRAEMAVFLLRVEHGALYTPPRPAGVFGDVPTTYWAAAWIEQLSAEGITGGCGGGNYCPDQRVTRAQMAKFVMSTPMLNTEDTVCGRNTAAVVLVVDPNLATAIGPGLDQFETDLCNEGYVVIEKVASFSNPPQARNYLISLYARTGGRLEGAIFIGRVPHAYQWVRMVYANPGIPPTEEEVISFQYYSDLDGTFSASPGYVSPGGHLYSYDRHTGTTDWEIWVGLLPYYKGNIMETINALNRYFPRNHSYRTGGYTLPRAFLEINELAGTAATQAIQDQWIADMRNGPYSWTPFSSSPTARLYVNGPTLSVSQGYADLNAGLADFTVTDTHGWWGGGGQIDIAWVENNPVKTVFFWSSGCAIGNIDHADNFLTSIVYSRLSMVLIGKGTTNDSGGMGTNQDGFYGHNVATSLTLGLSFGQAILEHVNVPLVYPWSDSPEFFFASVIMVGDPTLNLRP